MAKLLAMETTMSTIPSMDTKISDVERGVRDLNQQFAKLQEEVVGLREEVSVLRRHNEKLTQTNTDLMDRVDALEKKTDDLDGRSKRNNLIFHGIMRMPGETNEVCEGTIQYLLTDKLDMVQTIEFDRVHRLSSKPDSPIIARCCVYKDKNRILKEN
jgi:regulator of replication initiation timing